MLVPIELPDDLAFLLNTDEKALPKQLKLLLAIKLFEMGKVSLGKAAEIAGVSEVELITTLGEMGIDAFNYSEDELQEELELLSAV